MKRGTALNWLRERFEVDDTDECIYMPGNQTARSVKAEDGTVRLAYAIVCEWQNGLRPEGMEASHLCGNGHLGCVNRRHLVWETHAENMRRVLGHERALRGEQHEWSKLTEDDVRAIRVDTRVHTKIASDYGISKQQVSRIIAGTTWRHLA